MTRNPTTIIARTARTSGAGSISSVTANKITSARTPFRKKPAGRDCLSMGALNEFYSVPNSPLSSTRLRDQGDQRGAVVGLVMRLDDDVEHQWLITRRADLDVMKLWRQIQVLEVSIKVVDGPRVVPIHVDLRLLGRHLQS
jgi:hypothetical protein